MSIQFSPTTFDIVPLAVIHEHKNQMDWKALSSSRQNFDCDFIDQ